MKTSVMAHRRFWLAAGIGTFSSSLLQWVGRIADSQLLYKSPNEGNPLLKRESFKQDKVTAQYSGLLNCLNNRPKNTQEPKTAS